MSEKVFAILLVIVMIFIAVIAYADYEVKTIYFMPTDSHDGSDELNLDRIMKSIRNTFRNAMEKHGFHNKIYELETDKDNNVIVHKVKASHKKSHYAGNDTYFIVESELKEKGFDGRNSIYVTIMADMDLLKSGNAVGLAGALPLGGFFDDKSYWAYCMIAEKLTGNLESYIAHELAHCFGLSHIYNDSEYIMGGGDKLLFQEARWLSKNHYFNKIREYSKAPDISKVYPIKIDHNDKFNIMADISDIDGIFQVYGAVNSYVVGWDIFIGNTRKTVLEFNDIEFRYLANYKSIIFRAMDNDGNWKWHGPIEYDLPEKAPNKNENLGNIEDVTEPPMSIDFNNKLTISWALLKTVNRK